MRRVTALCCAVALMACYGGEQAETETAAAAPGAISLDQVAGTWNMIVMGTDSDSVVVSYQLMATATRDGWMMHLPERDPVPGRVTTVAGDSIVMDAGPFESVLRPGVMVSTRSVVRLRDGKLVGTTVARYQTTAPDSVVTLRTEGTRGM